MKLYKRDYKTLTNEEYADWQSLREQEVVRQLDNSSVEIRRSLFCKYPKAARHFTSLFPNNYLDIIELKDEVRLNKLVDKFLSLLNDSNVSERRLLNFINQESAYFIIGSILSKYFTFGHHDAFLFPEFPLGTTYKVDYLLIGNSSDGWNFVFVELESPNKNITIADGELGLAFRKGLNQISNWDAWLDANFPTLREVFEKYKNQSELLPSEFTMLDKSRIYYVVIAGRRNDFSDKTYRKRRKRSRNAAELILHYDNVLDTARNVIGRDTY